MNATIQFSCPQCSHQMQLPASLVGKQGKCPSCAQVVAITKTPEAAPPATPPAIPQPVQQQAPIQQQAPVQQQAPYQQQAPVQQQAPYQQQAPVQQQAPYQQQAPVQQQAPYQQQAPVQQQAIPGLGQGSSSVNMFRVFFNFWWLMIFYGMPITCRIPIAAGHPGASAVDAVAGLFLNRGFAKRSFGAKLVSGVTLKCPGAVFAIRDVRVKESGDSLHVIGYRRDISSILQEAGLLTH